MKIKVSVIQPNPYRDVKHYPFDKSKIESLKRSIQEKSFWDNVLARKTKNGRIELAYGHHRLEALKQLGTKEIDIPVRTDKELTDDMMIKIMAEENLEWDQSVVVLNQTVGTVKKFLDKELAKCRSYKELQNETSAGRHLKFKNLQGFGKAKKEGVGAYTILKFLGNNWSEDKIHEALDTLGYSPTAKKQPVDRKAVESIPTVRQARKFKREVRKHKLPVPIQRKIAKKIAKDGVSSRQVEEAVIESVPALMLKEPKKEKPKPMLDKFVVATCFEMGKLRRKLFEINKEYDSIQGKGNREGLHLSAKRLQEILTQILQRGQNEK